MSLVVAVSRSFGRAIGTSVKTHLGRFRSWPSDALLLDEPLALAEERTERLRRIYANAMRDAWDGPALFRDAVAKHGGIQLSHEKRVALAHPMSMLMWGELAAWIVSAELAERLEDSDARMAASSQVFDEARHFYTLRDYVALLHVPVPKLDPPFAIAARALLSTRDLRLKLFAMQILAEGTAVAIFRFLEESQVEPVLCELLPYIEKDEARHVGLGVLHLPQLLSTLTPRQCRKLGSKVHTIGDLFAATQLRYAKHYRTLGLEPRELIRRADKVLHELGQKLGKIPGTDEPYFRTADPAEHDYEDRLDFVVTRPGRRRTLSSRIVQVAIDVGARLLPV